MINYANNTMGRMQQKPEMDVSWFSTTSEAWGQGKMLDKHQKKGAAGGCPLVF